MTWFIGIVLDFIFMVLILEALFFISGIVITGVQECLKAKRKE